MILKQYVKFQVMLATRKVSKGQSLAEYGLILALIAVFCIVALQTLGTNISSGLNQLSGRISGAFSTTP